MDSPSENVPTEESTPRSGFDNVLKRANLLSPLSAASPSARRPVKQGRVLQERHLGDLNLDATSMCTLDESKFALDETAVLNENEVSKLDSSQVDQDRTMDGNCTMNAQQDVSSEEIVEATTSSEGTSLADELASLPSNARSLGISSEDGNLSDYWDINLPKDPVDFPIINPSDPNLEQSVWDRTVAVDTKENMSPSSFSPSPSTPVKYTSAGDDIDQFETENLVETPQQVAKMSADTQDGYDTAVENEVDGEEKEEESDVFEMSALGESLNTVPTESNEIVATTVEGETEKEVETEDNEEKIVDETMSLLTTSPITEKEDDKEEGQGEKEEEKEKEEEVVGKVLDETIMMLRAKVPDVDFARATDMDISPVLEADEEYCSPASPTVEMVEKWVSRPSSRVNRSTLSVHEIPSPIRSANVTGLSIKEKKEDVEEEEKESNDGTLPAATSTSGMTNSFVEDGTESQATTTRVKYASYDDSMISFLHHENNVLLTTNPLESVKEQSSLPSETEIAALAFRIQQLESELAVSQSLVEELKAVPASALAEVAEIREQTIQLSQALVESEKREREANENVFLIEHKANKLERTIEKKEMEVELLTEAKKEVIDKLEALRMTFATVTCEMESLKSDGAESADTQRKRAEEAESLANELKSRCDELAGALAANASELEKFGDMKREMDMMAMRWEEAKARISTLESELKEAHEAVYDSNGQMNSVEHNYIEEISSLKSQLEENRETIEGLKLKVEEANELEEKMSTLSASLTSTHSDHESTVSSLNLEIMQLKNDIDERCTENEKLSMELSCLSQDKESLRMSLEEMSSLKQQLAEKVERIGELEEKVGKTIALEEEVSTLSASLASALSDHSASMEAKTAELQKEIEEKNEKIETLLLQNATLSTETSSFTAQKEALTATVEELKTEIEALETKLAELAVNLENAKEKEIAYEERREVFEQKIDVLEAEVGRMEMFTETLKREKEEMMEKMREAEDKIAATNEEIASLVTKCSELESVNELLEQAKERRDEMEMENEKMKEQILKLNNDLEDERVKGMERDQTMKREIEEAIKDTEKKAEELSKELASVQELLSISEKKAMDAAVDLAEIEKTKCVVELQLASKSELMSELKERIDEQKTTIGMIKEAKDKLEKEVESLRSRPSADPLLETRLAEALAKIASLESSTLQSSISREETMREVAMLKEKLVKKEEEMMQSSSVFSQMEERCKMAEKKEEEMREDMERKREAEKQVFALRQELEQTQQRLNVLEDEKRENEMVERKKMEEEKREMNKCLEEKEEEAKRMIAEIEKLRAQLTAVEQEKKVIVPVHVQEDTEKDEKIRKLEKEVDRLGKICDEFDDLEEKYLKDIEELEKKCGVVNPFEQPPSGPCLLDAIHQGVEPMSPDHSDMMERSGKEEKEEGENEGGLKRGQFVSPTANRNYGNKTFNDSPDAANRFAPITPGANRTVNVGNTTTLHGNEYSVMDTTSDANKSGKNDSKRCAQQ